MSVPDFIFIALLLLFAVLAAYAVADSRKGTGRLPETWVDAIKNKHVPQVLLEYYRQYTDKQRFFLFWLHAKRLEKEGIVGDFAELGVYKGDTAKLLQLLAPERKLHLFDTFLGFTNEHLSAEKGPATRYSSNSFADTSLDLVKTKLGENPQIVYYAGNFADVCHQAAGHQFALVSLDVDLAIPTAEGLSFFYPRLVHGGVLIVHDYNTKWPALMEAVDQFLHSIPEQAVLIPDRDSSLVIVKNKVV